MDKLTKRSVLSLSVWVLFVVVAIYGIGYFADRAVKSEDELLAKSKQSMNYSVNGVIIKTNLGNIEIDFWQDKAPVTVSNFIKLAEEDFYKGTRFHRVIKDFMIQGGDPLSKDLAMKDSWGTGGPGYAFKDEIHGSNTNNVGTISMANAGPNTNGSQFFINVANNNFLDDKHTVFGEVVKGLDIVESISNVETDTRDRPLEDVIIQEIRLK